MSEEIDNSRNDLLAELTAEVVAAYVSNNVIQTGDLPGLIAEVHTALGSTTTVEPVSAREAEACCSGS